MYQLNPNCFVCLNNFHSNGESTRISNDLLAYSNYLKVSLNNEYSDGNVSFALCPRCEDVFKTFGKLLGELEIAQMRLDFCVTQIRKLLLEREVPDEGRRENEGSRSLRRNLVEKTLRKLKYSKFQPTVRISKTRVSRISAAKVCNPQSYEVDTTDLAKTEPVELEEEDNDDADQDQFDENGNSESNSKASLSDDVDKDETFLVKKEVITKYGVKRNRDYCLRCKMHITHPEAHLKEFHRVKISEGILSTTGPACPFCRAVFQQTRISKGRRYNNYGTELLQHHLLHYHCEHFFPNHRIKTVTESEFRKIVAELLFKDFVHGDTSCPLCTKKFGVPSKLTKKCNFELRIKKHYVHKHYEDLEKRLKEIQEDPNLRDELEESGPHGRYCECGVYLPNQGTWHTHKKFHCKLSEEKECFIIPNIKRKKLPPSVEAIDGKKYKCKKCGIIFGRTNINAHLTRYCKSLKANNKPNEKNKRRKKLHWTLLPVSQTSNPTKVKCNLCGTICLRSSARRHLRSFCKKSSYEINETAHVSAELDETVNAELEQSFLQIKQEDIVIPE